MAAEAGSTVSTALLPPVPINQSKLLSIFSSGSLGGTSSIWRIYDGQSGPLLRSFLTAATDTASKTYDGTASTASDRQTVVASGVTIKAPSQVSAARIGTGAPL